MPNVHPLLVHFPIALIFVIVVCDLIGMILHKESFIFTGTIVTVFAVLGAGAAVLSGLIAEESVEESEQVESLIQTHELLGFVYLGLILFLLIYRLALRKRLSGMTGWIAVIISVAAAVVVSIGGYIGGEMVYRYGTGVAAVQGAGVTEIDDHESEEAEDEEKRGQKY